MPFRIKQKKQIFGIGLLLIFLIFLLPRIILGQDSYVTIHDNLDSELVWRKVLTDSGMIFKNSGKIDQIMNGIPREFMVTGFNFTAAFFVLFNPFLAYVINELFVHLLAYLGMYLLVRRHIIPRSRSNLIPVGVAFCFALLPYYTLYGLSIAGQPLLLYALLNFYKGRGKTLDYIIVFTTPFYVSLALSGVFLVFSAAILATVGCLLKRKIHFPLLLALVLLTAGFCFSEYNLIKLTIAPEAPVSHRIERDLGYFGNDSIFCYNFKEVFTRTFKELFQSHRHRASLHRPIFILWLLVLSGFIVFLAGKYNLRKEIIISTILVILIIVISFVSALYYWQGIIPVKERIGFLKVFDLQRIDWLKPLIWFLVFSFCLSVLNKLPFGRYAVMIMLLIQVYYTVHNKENVFNEFILNRELIYQKITNQQSDIITYRQFYAVDLFSQIKEYISEKPQHYRVISLGFHPAIAQYNGFYTLDSYQNNYPLKYKHEFRRIIAGELERSNIWQRWYDYWGNRCYLFAAGLRGYFYSFSIWGEYFLPSKSMKNLALNLKFDTKAFKLMGGKYVFSAYMIKNADQIKLDFLKTFEDGNSIWKVYLYVVKDVTEVENNISRFPDNYD